MSRIDIIAILCPVLKDRFMHAADVFEPFKRLIEPEPFAVAAELEDGKPLEPVLAKFKEVLEATAQYEVLAVFHPYRPEGAWCNQEVIMVSTGYTFCKFADYLERLNYRGPMPRKYLDQKVEATAP